MKLNNKNILFSIVSMLFVCSWAWSQNGKAFTVILDAGHGGKDPGNSYHGFVEKEIALKTTLKVGKLLESEKDIKIIYTRTTDVFIELVNRPKVANKANANLFVSIHCNSVTNQVPSGTETFVMGLSRANMNLEVAKSENSVILLEDNYKETYQGFDPKKPESLIGLTMMQEENLNSSIDLATKIQDNFTNNLERKSRGVKQQPLWVLDAAYMPSVLIELGFLSNKEEGEFLNSDEGQNKMASQIAEAIIKYKKEYFNEAYNTNENVKYLDRKVVKEVAEPIAVKAEETAPTANVKEGLYKIQLFATSKKRETTSPDFKGLKNISFTLENKLYKYFYGSAVSLEEAKKLNEEAKNQGFPDSFIVTTVGGKTAAFK
ncbi:N-acetylmuramoyl-L-alanine amidase [Flavobacterium buctense]|uniref:N-acetylmuramoyl-L-alanine amidase n=1 Tax=Flavobacterium buctense TaxID=1648146 RepID=A0ABU9E224_9FLAO|nr:N-acetylmuramoyl-L-alanine amidase [Flavobacterium buctense]